MAATTQYLNEPALSAEKRALKIGRAALREIADETATMGPEATAAAALDAIQALVPEAAGSPFYCAVSGGCPHAAYCRKSFTRCPLRPAAAP